jgi:PKD repeat protein
MKKAILLMSYAIISASTALGQCPSQFTFAANSETLIFSNQSSVSNAHYFWNFGDGTGSNNTSPIHTFPETGKYLVTLFALDTVSNCSSYYEQWINVTMSSTNTCQPIGIKDSVFPFAGPYYILLTDSSSNCINYSKLLDGGEGVFQSTGPGNWLFVIAPHARYVTRIRYFDYTNNPLSATRSLYKTTPFKYTSAKNYNGCSANFEFRVVSQNANGKRILFRPMNRTVTSCAWKMEAGGPITLSNNDTVSQFFSYFPFTDQLWNVTLKTTDSTGCKDTLCQTILIHDTTLKATGLKKYVDNLNLMVHPNPAHDNIVVSSASEIDKIILMNSLGQEMFALNKSKPIQEVDISYLPCGIYFLKTETQQKQKVFKFVKE